MRNILFSCFWTKRLGRIEQLKSNIHNRNCFRINMRAFSVEFCIINSMTECAFNISIEITNAPPNSLITQLKFFTISNSHYLYLSQTHTFIDFRFPWNLRFSYTTKKDQVNSVWKSKLLGSIQYKTIIFFPIREIKNIVVVLFPFQKPLFHCESVQRWKRLWFTTFQTIYIYIYRCEHFFLSLSHTLNQSSFVYDSVDKSNTLGMFVTRSIGMFNVLVSLMNVVNISLECWDEHSNHIQHNMPFHHSWTEQSLSKHESVDLLLMIFPRFLFYMRVCVHVYEYFKRVNNIK